MLRSYDAEMAHNDLSAERSDRGVQERLAPDRPAAADHHVSAAGRKPSRPVSMFSALGHRDTIWSDVKGDLTLSRQIAWDGCTAATHKIITASGDAEIRSRSLELHFSWNSGYVEAEAESARQVRAYRNRPRYRFILPPNATAEFRIKEKRNYQFLTIELDLGYVLRSLEVQDLPGVEVIETWEYDDPLSWQIAQAIRADCEHDAPQGLLYSETRQHSWLCRSSEAFRTAETQSKFTVVEAFRLPFCGALASIWRAGSARISRFARSQACVGRVPDTSPSPSNSRPGLRRMPGCAVSGWTGQEHCCAIKT